MASDTLTGPREIGLLNVVAILWRRRLTMAGIVAAFGLIAFAVSYLIEPVYRSTIVLASAESADNSGKLAGISGQLGGLAALAGLPLDQSARIEESIAILTSRFFTEKFIAENELLPVLFAGLWDESAGGWQVDEEDEIPTLADGYALMDGSVRRLSRDAASGLVTMSIDWKDPERAAAWANGMIQAVNLHLRNRAVVEAEKSIEFLNAELSRTSAVEARSAMFSLMETQIQKIMLANVREEYAFRVIDPAAPAELDNFVKPNRPLLAVLGLAIGIVMSAVLALFLAVREALA